ncbi:hypothetical protein [Modestobacter versicolor]|uniref:Polysaccharide biosynthesis protein C-terminal domain-containing protein n=1 Tax=Modestobacter versicolor TaxID=429133 RepID=A0A323VFY2_9ACTN|nr:hypothetical protein [Modestobacter versicolor]MBB3676992.1 hypothetical protein [Modestobacter versicolor]PZA22963.1 hypothetical protein DMO24_02415 [Modestobacter versicolor]
MTRWLQRIPVPLRRMSAFALLPVLSTLSNLVLLPTVSSLFGQPGWTSVVLGQGIGAAASVVCSLQWPTEGPALVATSPADRRPAILRASMRSRGVVVAACLPLTALVVWLVQPADPLVCVLSAFSVTAIGLSPAWYFIGIGRPGALVWLEGVPRLVGNAVSLGLLLLLDAPLWTFPLVMLVVSCGTALVSWSVVAGRTRRGPHVWRNPQGRRSLGFATFARTLDAGYSFIAGPVVALLAPAAYPLFGACDRLAKVVLGGLAIVPQGAAGWVSEPPTDRERAQRARRASVLVLPLALLVAAFLAVATPTLVRLLFAGTVSVGHLTSALAGAVVALAFLGHALFLTGLAPIGSASQGYRYLIAAFTVGLPALVVGALVEGANGALIGSICSGLVLTTLSLRRIWSVTAATVAAAPAPAPVLCTTAVPGQSDRKAS